MGYNLLFRGQQVEFEKMTRKKHANGRQRYSVTSIPAAPDGYAFLN
jgi:hypothetical protein